MRYVLQGIQVLGIVKANFKKIIRIIWAVYTCPNKRSSIKYTIIYCITTSFT